MSSHRGEENTQISISLEKSLLDEIDARAASLSMTRSAYLVHLAKLDLVESGAIRPAPVKYTISRRAIELNEQSRKHISPKTKRNPPPEDDHE